MTAGVLDAGRAFHNAGFCVVPAAADGSKRPGLDGWKQYQHERPKGEQVRAWLANGHSDGLGVICGAVSGGLEMLEFEGRALAEGLGKAWLAVLADHGMSALWRRIVAGYSETTPSGGLHVLYRVDGQAKGNTKLARRPATAEELAADPADRIKVLVETRGEGGFVVVAPSAGRTHPTGRAWTLQAGGPGSVAVITEAERDGLYRVARLLDDMPAPVSRPVPAPRPAADGTLRPGDDFAARITWAELLEPAGWTLLRSHPHYDEWRRPGKTEPGLSATTRPDGGLFVFSTSTEFEPERAYSKLGAYAVLNFGGDGPTQLSAAAGALRREGYGSPLPARPPVLLDDHGDGQAPAFDGDGQPPAPSLGPVLLRQITNAGPLGLPRRALDEHGQGVTAALDNLFRAGLVRRVGAQLVAADADEAASLPLFTMPAYPESGLVGPLADFVAWARRDGLNPALAAGAGLAALATAASDARAYVGSMLAPPSLWIPLVGPASAGKSPVLAHGFEQVRAIYSAALEGYNSERETWQANVAAADGDKRLLGQIGPAPERPPSPITGDSTIEALARKMDANAGAIAYVVDELDAFLSGLGQYTGGRSGADRAKLREMWTGTAPVDISRVGDGGGRNAINIFFRSPVLTVCGPLLPEDLPNLGSDTKGDRARWLPHAGAGKPRMREHPEPKPAAWVDVFALLAAASGQRRTWQIRGEAFGLWRRARDRWESESEQPDPEPVIQALRKADNQCARIALVLAESLDPGQSGGDECISADVMQCAIAITDYVIDVWRALPVANSMVASRQEEVLESHAGRLLAWIEDRPAGIEGLPEGSAARPRATRSEIQRWLHLPPAKLSALLLDFADRYPGCVVGPVPNARGPASTYFYAPPRESRGDPGRQDT